MIACLNMFPPKYGISSKLRPASIILGYPNPDYNKLNIKLGAYAQVYIGTTNIKKHRTAGAIALRLENERGKYYFMSIAAGKQIHAFIWTELPINYQVISIVNYLATKENQPEMTKGYKIFEWGPGTLTVDKDNEKQSKEDEIASTHKYKQDDDITENGEEEESI